MTKRKRNWTVFIHNLLWTTIISSVSDFWKCFFQKKNKKNSWGEHYVHVCSEDTCVFLSYVSWPWLCGLREPPADVQIQHFISIWIISAAGLWVWLELNTERNLEMLLPVWDRRVTTCWHRVNNPHGNPVLMILRLLNHFHLFLFLFCQSGWQ